MRRSLIAGFGFAALPLMAVATAAAPPPPPEPKKKGRLTKAEKKAAKRDRHLARGRAPMDPVPAPDPTRQHHRVSPEGRAVGEQLVRLTEPTIAQLVSEGEEDDRCKSCAFRLGTVPNGCIQTQADAMKAVIEDVPFLCHQADKKGWPCFGWYAARVALKRAEKRRGRPLDVTCPWEFSPPEPEPSSSAPGVKGGSDA